MKKYDVILSYPIQVTAEDETHVKQMIKENQYLGEIKNLELKIIEVEEKKEKEWEDTVGIKKEEKDEGVH
jgi:hypothetical protein|tara:strand:- start:7 stop:216 length:210 start_codon:yes stop_codon:yes gene_type:complete